MMIRRSLVLTAVVACLMLRMTPTISADPARPYEVPPGPPNGPKFSPPPEDTIPNSPLGDMIRPGLDIFVGTHTHAKAYVGNGLN